MWGYVIGIISVAEGSEAHSIAGMSLEGGRISGCYNKNGRNTDVSKSLLNFESIYFLKSVVCWLIVTLSQGINSKMFSIDIVLLIEISVKNSTALKAIITTWYFGIFQNVHVNAYASTFLVMLWITLSE